MSDAWQQDTGETDTGFEQTLVNQIAREFLAEQRRARRWNIAFRLIIVSFMLLFLLIYLFGKTGLSPGKLSDGKHTALIDIQGVIASSEQARADYVTASCVRLMRIAIRQASLSALTAREAALFRQVMSMMR